MAVDALATCATSSSGNMVLNMKHKQIFVIYKEELE